MANHFEVRLVQTKTADGQVCGERWQYRTKDITAAALGFLPLALVWSDWQDVNVLVVDEPAP